MVKLAYYACAAVNIGLGYEPKKVVDGKELLELILKEAAGSL